MASKRDLVEAHGYNRRRLISAFVSGAPRGRDVESISRSRPVIGGIAASVLLIGGTAIAGMLTSPLDSGWSDAHVVIAKQSAARYVAEKGTLYPVVNATSARLMLPAAAGFPVIVVDDDKIASTPKGPARGILGAPDDLPPAGSLIDAGWVSCLVGDATATSLRRQAIADPERRPAMIVTSGATHWLLVGGARYAVPADKVGAVTRELQISSDFAAVPGPWLDLLPQGGPLTLAIDRLGGELSTAYSMGGKIRRIGQVVRAAGDTTSQFLVVADGTVPLTPFAAALYRAFEPELANVANVTGSDLAALPTSKGSTKVYPSSWPDAMPVLAKGLPCVTLTTGSIDTPASASFVTVPSDSVWAKGAATFVEPGAGALVRVTSAGSPSGPVFVIDQSGRKFAVLDPSEETLARLGYAGQRPRTLPGAWILLFPSGPALSEQAALATPAPAAVGP
ncbi:MAG: type VII secretion protein EccB [Dermatophilaceae bacterium]|jgi:type VII secretion protein EccB